MASVTTTGSRVSRGGGVIHHPEEELVGIDHRRLGDLGAAAGPFAVVSVASTAVEAHT